MIKFFRKIRYDLMGKNKTGKYLKYAIGEIILVVIGILIALSINNWNQGKKRINQGKEYVNEINNDVKNDVANINNVLNELEDQKQGSQFVLSVFESKDKFVADSSLFVDQNLKTSQIIPVQRQSNTWDELKATGQIGIIANDSLKTLLKQFYEQYDTRIYRYLETPGQVRNANRTTMQECLSKTSTDKFWKEGGNKNYDKSWFSCYLNSPEALKEIRAIYSSTHWQEKWFKDLLNIGQSVIVYMDKTLPEDL